MTGLSGWLGAFEVEWRQENPIDLELCTRCNACIRACPEDAIDFDYQVDLAKCKEHRDCVKACGSIGAIDFSRPEIARNESFDLVLDLSRAAAHQPAAAAAGLFRAGRRSARAGARRAEAGGRWSASSRSRKFFQYREKICAHSRSGKQGCNVCIDVCSSGAISADGDHVKIEPHLCAGCGGCATVCPSGAMTYVYPKVPDMGARLKAALATYRDAGGKDACILFHDATEGRAALLAHGRKGKGLPGRVHPDRGLPCRLDRHGPDAWRDCVRRDQIIILSPTRCRRLCRGPRNGRWATRRPSSTRSAMRESTSRVIENPADLWELQPAATVAKPASFNLSPEKRTTLDFALDHLATQRRAEEAIPLPAGAPFGALAVNKQTCTLCKACIGACPESALIDAHRDARAALHRAQLRAVRAVRRTPAPRTPSRWFPGW